MLLLRHRVPEQFARTFDQVVLLLLLNLLVWAGLDTLHAEAGSTLMLDGLYGWAFYLLAGLFACALVGRAHCREAETRSLLIPALSVSPYVLIICWLLSDLWVVQDRPGVSTVVLIIYLIVLSVRLVQAAYGTARAKAVMVAMALVIVAPWVLKVVNIDTRLWLTDDAQEEQTDDAAAEHILYEQPGRIAAAVEHLAARDPRHSSVFYVGFAGDGDQSIFKREALFGETVLGQHFGSTDRSVELINDADDRDSYPLASLSALQQTLRLLAERMDPDEDVLVLFLTSHGSADGMTVANGSLPLLQLGPADLQHALEDSGIRWRIIIISACYAGVFIDALKDPGTLIVTAADATHSSFGCDDDRDLTYFGEAFLKDSLPGSASFEEAFQKATDLIRQREQAEHKAASNPQMFVGSEVHDKLLEVERASHPHEHGTIVANH